MMLKVEYEGFTPDSSSDSCCEISCMMRHNPDRKRSSSSQHEQTGLCWLVLEIYDWCVHWSLLLA